MHNNVFSVCSITVVTIIKCGLYIIFYYRLICIQVDCLNAIMLRVRYYLVVRFRS